jgi:hypothetical protein
MKRKQPARLSTDTKAMTRRAQLEDSSALLGYWVRVFEDDQELVDAIIDLREALLTRLGKGVH